MAKIKKKPLSAYVRRQARIAKALSDRESIVLLRKHFVGYDPRDGVKAGVNDVLKMDRHKRYRIRKKAQKIRSLLAVPHSTVKPKTPKDRKALRRFTHERMRGMKHFIVQKPSEASRVTVKAGKVELTTKFPGELRFKERFYLFERDPRGPGDLARMLEKMLKDAPEGMYIMQTAKYGDTGVSADKGQIINLVREYLAAYDKPKYGDNRFMSQITGVRYMSTTLQGARVQQAARDERRRGQRAFNQKQRERIREEAQKRARRNRK